MTNPTQLTRYEVYPYLIGVEGEEDIYLFYFMHDNTSTGFIAAILFGDNDTRNLPIAEVEEKINEWRETKRVEQITTLFSGIYLNEEDAMYIKFLIDR